MIPQIETLRKLHNLGNKKYNKDLESIEYTNHRKTKIVLVVADVEGKTGKVDTISARKIMSFFENTEFNEVIVFAETQSASAYNILKNNDKTMVITSKARVQLKAHEILDAFNQLAFELCKIECNTEPLQRSDCIASKKGSQSCPVRNHIDNAEFHCKMGWKEQLLNDFSCIIELKSNLSRASLNM
jgi:hypothetical protein